MQNAIVRLQAQKQLYVEGLIRMGEVDGSQWAMGSADYEQLKNLSNEEVYGDRAHSPLNLTVLWDAVKVNPFSLDMPAIEQNYIDGFVCGALKVFKQVG